MWVDLSCRIGRNDSFLQLNLEVLKSLKHPPKTVTKESILKEHEELDRGEKQFKGPLLAYITPVREFSEGLVRN